MVFRYEKYREEFGAEDIVVAIDETPVGVFVELEGNEQRITEMVHGLGRTADDFLTASYRGLFLAWREAHPEAGEHMVFPDTAS